MTDKGRTLKVEVEVPGTPDEVWEAIATGPGITSWFMPAEVEPHVGGTVTHDHGVDAPSTGTVTAYDRPHRFAYEEEGLSPESGPLATEFQVEARGGGICVVRVVMSGLGDTEEWDQAIESFSTGWAHVLRALTLYLERFRGQPMAPVSAGVVTSGDHDSVWAGLANALGLPTQPRVGQRIATSGNGAPALAGTVEHVSEHSITLALDEPAEGLGMVGVGGPGEQVFVIVREQFFGSGAAELAAREQTAWKEWLTGLMSAV